MMSNNEEILSSIKCPACIECMQAPIYLCKTGHSICQDCWKRLTSCPYCRKDLLLTRNYSLETIVQLLYYPCDNSKYGCKEYFKLTEMCDHLTTCSFRTYKCKVSICEWQGRRTAIKDHFLSAHKDITITGTENSFCWKESRCTLHLMVAYEEIFYVHTRVHRNYIYWVVQYIGKSEDKIQYYFQVNIFKDQDKNRMIRICENCQDDLQEDIRKTFDYAVRMPISMLKSYMNEEGQVWYNISIQKKKNVEL